MGGAKGVSTTREGKKVTVAALKEDLQRSQMIFAVQSSQLKCNQVTELRKKLPASTKARVVKNTLLRVAATGMPEWEVLCKDMSKGENMWFFVEEDLSESVTAVKDAMKEYQKKDTHAPKYGVLEGNALDAAGVEAIAGLPTKTELYRRIAVGINAVPTRIARGINLVPTKVARSVKLAFADEEKAGAPAAEALEA
jgi:large subunit ribosomal protein L10